MIIVNIEVYGDFDMPTTVALMAAPEGMDKGTVKAFCDETSKMLADTRNSDEAIKMLKTVGFTTVKSCTVRIGGNL